MDKKKSAGCGSAIVALVCISLVIANPWLLIIPGVILIGIIVYFIIKRKKEKESKVYDSKREVKRVPKKEREVHYEDINLGHQTGLIINSRTKYAHSDPDVNKEIVVLDLETTGKNWDDEILQIAVIDFNGNTLLNEYVNPQRHASWPEAQEVNHISPEKVADCPTIDSLRDKIKSAINNKIVAGYNIHFDYKFLMEENLIDAPYRIIDLMRPFSQTYGEWSDFHGDYRFKSLNDCSKYYGYSLGAKSHNAIEDVKATLHCLKRMNNLEILTLHYFDKKQEEKEQLLKANNASDSLTVYIRNLPSQKWTNFSKLAKSKRHKLSKIKFSYLETDKNDKTKPHIILTHEDGSILGEITARAGIYEQFKPFIDNGEYDIIVNSRSSATYYTDYATLDILFP